MIFPISVVAKHFVDIGPFRKWSLKFSAINKIKIIYKLQQTILKSRSSYLFGGIGQNDTFPAKEINDAKARKFLSDYNRNCFFILNQQQQLCSASGLIVEINTHSFKGFKLKPGFF